MTWLNVLGIAIGLAMDAFAVSIASGLTIRKVTVRHIFRIAFHFGLFQFLMPIIGWAVASRFVGLIEAVDHWIAFGLLTLIGGKMLIEAIHGEPHAFKADPSRGWTLVGLSIATSIDALAVGVTMGCINASVWLPAVVIGLVAGVFSFVGITYGPTLLKRWGRSAEVLGGIVLIAIGIRVLIQHTT